MFSLLLTALWFWAVYAFAKWRLRQLKRDSKGETNILGDWAVQLFLKGTGLLLVGFILLALRLCS